MTRSLRAPGQFWKPSRASSNHPNSCFLEAWKTSTPASHPLIDFAYSFLASFKMGMSGSAAFKKVKDHYCGNPTWCEQVGKPPIRMENVHSPDRSSRVSAAQWHPLSQNPCTAVLYRPLSGRQDLTESALVRRSGADDLGWLDELNVLGSRPCYRSSIANHSHNVGD